MKTTYQTLLTVALALAGSACANYPGNPNLRKAPAGSNSTGSYLTSGSGSGSCASTPNITPEHETSYDGRDHYTACAVSDAKFRISGESSSGSQSLCMFPAQVYENGQVWIKKDTRGNPLSLCATVDAENGTDFSFEHTNYNAIFVAPMSVKTDMMICLASNNPLICPNHSFGKFR
jgi:hypothetical protein